MAAALENDQILIKIKDLDYWKFMFFYTYNLASIAG